MLVKPDNGECVDAGKCSELAGDKSVLFAHDCCLLDGGECVQDCDVPETCVDAVVAAGNGDVCDDVVAARVTEGDTEAGNCACKGRDSGFRNADVVVVGLMMGVWLREVDVCLSPEVGENAESTLLNADCESATLPRGGVCVSVFPAGAMFLDASSESGTTVEAASSTT
jgi:hypothetical protein